LDDKEEMHQQTRLQKKSHPIDQLDKEIKHIRRMMLRSSQEEASSRRRWNRGEPTEAKKQQKQQQQGARPYGQLQIQIWDPRGSQPQQQGSHEQELMIFSAHEYDAGASLHLKKHVSTSTRQHINQHGGMGSKGREAPSLSF
jgi:hypothetical protein